MYYFINKQEYQCRNCGAEIPPAAFDDWKELPCWDNSQSAIQSSMDWQCGCTYGHAFCASCGMPLDYIIIKTGEN